MKSQARAISSYSQRNPLCCASIITASWHARWVIPHQSELRHGLFFFAMGYVGLPFQKEKCEGWAMPRWAHEEMRALFQPTLNIITWSKSHVFPTCTWEHLGSLGTECVQLLSTSRTQKPSPSWHTISYLHYCWYIPGLNSKYHFSIVLEEVSG